MAVTNTGIVERVITGVNESDLWLDAEATSVVSNTGAVERSITGVHDANFVKPLGDEEITNGDFSNSSTGWQSFNANASIVDEKLECNNVVQNVNIVAQINAVPTQKYVKLQYDVVVNSGSFRILLGSSGTSTQITTSGRYAFYETSGTGGTLTLQARGGGFDGSVDNISVKEVLVSRESTATNTGIVERGVTGVNESDLWLDAESTSVVNNTGIVERPIVGVNESDEMFPDNTISNIVNIAGLISSLIADLKARATTFENEDATQEILINLQKC